MKNGNSDFPDFVRGIDYEQLLKYKKRYSDMENRKRWWIKKHYEEAKKKEEEREYPLWKMKEGIQNLQQKQNRVLREAQKLSRL